MTRKPRTSPLDTVTGRPPLHAIPTLRPSGEVPEDRASNWIPLQQAVETLATVLPSPKAALDQIMLAVMLDELPASCRLLVYERADDQAEHQARHPWPDRSAKIGAQLLAARNLQAGLTVSPASGNITWADVTGGWPVQAIMFQAHVDADVLLDIFRREVPDLPERRTKPFDGRTTWEEIVAWYQERVKTAPPRGYTRAEDDAAASAVGIIRERVREARNQYKPAHWSAGGSPGKLGKT